MAARGEKVVWDKDCKKQVVGSLGTSEELQAVIKQGAWNDYVVIAEGNHLRHFINGRSLTPPWPAGLETAVFRTYIHLSSEPERRERFVNTLGIFLIVAPALSVALIAAVLLVPISSFFTIRPEAFGLALAGVAVTVPATILPMAILRAQERLADYLRVSVITVVAHTGLMIGLVVVLHMGIIGWLLAALLGSAVQLVVGLWVLGHRWTRAFEVPLLMGALAFGLPLVPHALSHWMLALSDRAVLGAYVNSSQIGIYNLAYQLGVPMGLLAVAANQGIMPIYAEATHDLTRRAVAEFVGRS